MVFEEVTPFTVFAVEVALIIIVSIATGRANTFANIAVNGIIMVMAGGTLLFDGRVTGFVLLIYGIFLMSMGIKEYEEKKFLKNIPLFAKLLKVLGHYVIISIIMLTVLAVEYLGFDIAAYGSLAIPILAGLLLL
jgi:hypothetical protein